MKQMLKVTAFYPKKILFKLWCLNMPRFIQNMALAVLIFSEGFGMLVQLTTMLIWSGMQHQNMYTLEVISLEAS